jgi:hypothetical protein
MPRCRCFSSQYLSSNSAGYRPTVNTSTCPPGLLSSCLFLSCAAPSARTRPLDPIVFTVTIISRGSGYTRRSYFLAVRCVTRTQRGRLGTATKLEGGALGPRDHQLSRTVLLRVNQPTSACKLTNPTRLPTNPHACQPILAYAHKKTVQSAFSLVSRHFSNFCFSYHPVYTSEGAPCCSHTAT